MYIFIYIHIYIFTTLYPRLKLQADNIGASRSRLLRVHCCAGRAAAAAAVTFHLLVPLACRPRSRLSSPLPSPSTYSSSYSSPRIQGIRICGNTAARAQLAVELNLRARPKLSTHGSGGGGGRREGGVIYRVMKREKVANVKVGKDSYRITDNHPRFFGSAFTTLPSSPRSGLFFPRAAEETITTAVCASSSN